MVKANKLGMRSRKREKKEGVERKQDILQRKTIWKMMTDSRVLVF